VSQSHGHHGYFEFSLWDFLKGVLYLPLMLNSTENRVAHTIQLVDEGMLPFRL
jgi:hypothetical protein